MEMGEWLMASENIAEEPLDPPTYIVGPMNWTPVLERVSATRQFEEERYLV